MSYTVNNPKRWKYLPIYSLIIYTTGGESPVWIEFRNLSFESKYIIDPIVVETDKGTPRTVGYEVKVEATILENNVDATDFELLLKHVSENKIVDVKLKLKSNGPDSGVGATEYDIASEDFSSHQENFDIWGGTWNFSNGGNSNYPQLKLTLNNIFNLNMAAYLADFFKST